MLVLTAIILLLLKALGFKQADSLIVSMRRRLKLKTTN
jgi:hypothetical protein